MALIANCALIAGVASWPVLAVAQASPMTPADLIARHIQARGGAAALSSIRTLDMSGTMRPAGFNADLGYSEVIARPGSVRIEATLQGMTPIQAYDGKGGWQIQPFQGRKDPEALSADDAKSLQEEADFEDALVDYKAKGSTVDDLGEVDVDGGPTYALRVNLKNGDQETFYLDPDSYLTVRVVTRQVVRGAETLNETDYGDYEKVNGVYFPFEVDSGPKGATDLQRITYKLIKANTDISPAIFQEPRGAPSGAIQQSVTPTQPEDVPVTTKTNKPGAPPPATSMAKPGRAATIVRSPKTMRKACGPTLSACTAAAAFGCAIAMPPQALAQPAPRFDRSTLYGLDARNIGSAAMSGRVSAIAGRVGPDGKSMLLVGAASGGVWRSNDGGTTFRPIFDREPVQSIGAIALDPNHKDTIWVGTGESWMRNSVSVGDGVYKSTDGGESWTHMGLPNSEHISQILVDPSDSDTVYACVPGRLWSDSADRGLYKTTDGGRTWVLILKGSNLSTGCSSLAMDPKTPKKLFAGLWDFRRKGWTFRSGGEDADQPSGSALMVTQNGGATWSKLDATTAPGLPKGPWGREAVSIAPSNSNIVYAFVESPRSALFRSEDGGRTWKERDRSQNMVWRPFYFASLIVDPKNSERLFKTDFGLIVSEDGGGSFSEVGSSTHADHHAVWIDPTNTQHMVTGNDGGLWISYDGGARWVKSDNLPISQFYHVSVDQKDPYQVYGGLQDNSAWVGDSAYPGGISNGRWENLGGGDGFWAWADPADPEGYAYVESQGGSVLRVNRKTLEARDIQPKSDTPEKLRFNWNTPIALSPNEKGTLYIGAQYLYRSRDHGQSWDKISPDLTTNDKDEQKQEQSGGVTVDNSAAEMHTTIYAISESPKQAGLIWVGTDDGEVQLTRDGGKSWTNLTANIGLPPQSWVSWIEASRYAPGTAYAAFDRHTFGDMATYVFRTTDYGRTWTPIVRPDQGVRGFAHVIKEDPQRPDLLYVGTEFGLWISPDGGRRWAQFKGHDFPDVAVRDLAFQTRDGDLAVATHGRGIWIIDDLSPLRALTPQVMARDLVFLPSRPAQQRIEANGGWSNGDAQFVGDDPADGAFITYYEPHRRLVGKLTLEVLDPSGKLIDTLPASTRPGINRVVWSMRAPAPRVPPAAQLAGSSALGPRWLPGTYTARLTSNGAVLTQAFPIVLDRRVSFTSQDRRAQFQAAQRVSALFGHETDLLTRINAVREGASDRAEGLPMGDPLKARLTALSNQADVLRKEIVATKEGGAITGEERLREHTDQLYGAINSWEGQPSAYQLTRATVLEGQLADISSRFDALARGELAGVNDALSAHKLSPITLPAPRPPGSQVAGGAEPLKALGGWRLGLRQGASGIAAQGVSERD